jgi:hypothetical protein
MSKNRFSPGEGTTLSAGANPNVPWCTDFKGEFTLANFLTVTDHACRYPLCWQAKASA